MPSERELLARIRQLEEQNSALRDKLDMIYAIIASDYEEDAERPESSDLIQIDDLPSERRKPD